MTIWNLFSTPIYSNIFEYTDLDTIQKEIKDAIDLVKSNNDIVSSNYFHSEHDPLNTKVYGNITTSKFLNEYSCSELVQKISENVNQYFSNIGIKGPINLNIKNSWVTFSDRGNYTQTHHHQSCDISGIYYYKTSGKDGNLYFRTPTKYMEISNIFSRSSSDYSSQDYEITPVTGMIILFPSWLDHGVRSNSSDSERISISFNINSLD
jgi:uncharacterized protein (TIGR02466 family)